MNKKVINEIPFNRLFQFDDYYYIWKIKMHSTRGIKIIKK
jgi:hypothetical protein